MSDADRDVALSFHLMTSTNQRTEDTTNSSCLMKTMVSKIFSNQGSTKGLGKEEEKGAHEGFLLRFGNGGDQESDTEGGKQVEQGREEEQADLSDQRDSKEEDRHGGDQEHDQSLEPATG